MCILVYMCECGYTCVMGLVWMSKGSFWYQFLSSSLPSSLRKAFLLLVIEHTRLIGSRTSGDSPASSLSGRAWAYR